MSVTATRATVEAARGLDTAALADIASGMARAASAFAEQVPVGHDERTGLRLIGTDLYDVWLLRWPPGTSVSPHDHGVSAGAFSVVDGGLREVRWSDGRAEARTVRPGEVVTIERGVVHDVIGIAGSSLSVHVYSPPLTSMSYYEAPGQRDTLSEWSVPSGRY